MWILESHIIRNSCVLCQTMCGDRWRAMHWEKGEGRMTNGCVLRDGKVSHKRRRCDKKKKNKQATRYCLSIKIPCALEVLQSVIYCSFDIYINLTVRFVYTPLPPSSSARRLYPFTRMRTASRTFQTTRETGGAAPPFTMSLFLLPGIFPFCTCWRERHAWWRPGLFCWECGEPSFSVCARVRVCGFAPP